MDSSALHIRLLKTISIRCRDKEVTGGRARKPWLLLAYLIWEQDRSVPYEELIDLLWSGQDRSDSTFNALKAILHRARACLDPLYSDAGRTLVLSKRGACSWNSAAPTTVDAKEFLRLCRRSEEAADEEKRLSLLLRALSLYEGDFLPELAGHPWVDETAARLHRQYLKAALAALPLLAQRERWQEAAALSQAAAALEPCREEFCRSLMEALLHLDRRQEAGHVYESFQEHLLAYQGVLPSDELRALYWDSQRLTDPRAISSVTLLQQLQEAPAPGALFCDYDFFRAICRCMARMAQRSGDPIHVLLLSVSGAKGGELPRSSLTLAMDHLQETICTRLRRGDVAARCSASQFAVLLPRATYDNSRTVCDRVTRAFVRQYPHSPAVLQAAVLPLLADEPAKCEAAGAALEDAGRLVE